GCCQKGEVVQEASNTICEKRLDPSGRFFWRAARRHIQGCGHAVDRLQTRSSPPDAQCPSWAIPLENARGWAMTATTTTKGQRILDRVRPAMITGIGLCQLRHRFPDGPARNNCIENDRERCSDRSPGCA